MELRLLILAVAFLIGSIVFLINIRSNNTIIQIDNILVIQIEILSLLINLYSGVFLFLSAFKTFQKLSVGIISSIYFGAIPLLTR